MCQYSKLKDSTSFKLICLYLSWFSLLTVNNFFILFQEIEFGGYMIQQNVGGHPVAIFRFPPRTKFAEESTITIWSGSKDLKEHQPPKDFVWKEQQKWGTGPECTTILCKPNGQVSYNS